MEIKRGGAQLSAQAPAEHFTGAVRVDPLFQPSASRGAVPSNLSREHLATSVYDPNLSKQHAHETL